MLREQLDHLQVDEDDRRHGDVLDEEEAPRDEHAVAADTRDYDGGGASEHGDPVPI